VIILKPDFTPNAGFPKTICSSSLLGNRHHFPLLPYLDFENISDENNTKILD